MMCEVYVVYICVWCISVCMKCVVQVWCVAAVLCACGRYVYSYCVARGLYVVCGMDVVCSSCVYCVFVCVVCYM